MKQESRLSHVLTVLKSLKFGKQRLVSGQSIDYRPTVYTEYLFYETHSRHTCLHVHCITGFSWPYVTLHVHRQSVLNLAGSPGQSGGSSCSVCSITAQLCPAISAQLRHVSTIEKNLLNSNISPTQYGELRPTNG